MKKKKLEYNRMKNNIILASKSKSREKILIDAGLSIEAIASNIDEDIIKTEMLKEGATYKDISEKLAQDKAINIASFYPKRTIIGGDQLLVCEDKVFSKANSLDEALEHLKFFRGKAHKLITSISIIVENEVVWTHTEQPILHMKNLTDDFLNTYIEEKGEAILQSVGCYLLEENGKDLFSKIEGDYNSILGMPLSPLMDKLNELNLLENE